jgi:ABC-type glutathione transport system ATPase component
MQFVNQGRVNEAISGITLAVGEGEIVGLVGESGSGKSVTAMNILQLLPKRKTRIAEGQVTVLGRDVIRMREKELRKLRGAEVAMIFQEPTAALNPVLRVRSQMFDVIQRHQNLSREQALELSLRLLADMHIPDPARVLDSFPHELSGGMRQRVMIAMAFSCSPKMIIADEPTTALDVTIQAQILSLLKEKAEQTGTAVLMITHDLAVVSLLCDRVYVMYRGKIVEHGSTEDVIHNPQHAYTRALLQAIPEGKEPKTRLSTIATSLLAGETAQRHTTAASEPDSGIRGGAADRQLLLEASECTVRYGKDYDLLGRPVTYHTAVDRADLRLYAGETLSIVGESGSGKTSLANAIVGLAPLAGGVIQYKGLDIAAQDPATRREIQMVFQDPQSSLDPRWPVWKILTEPLTATGPRRTRAELREQAVALSAMVDLDADVINRLPHEFSGGQRQRIAIGRALSVRPQLLILDEPTSALDVSVQAQILNLILDLQRDHGLTYLFISHDVAVVRHISDRVAVMYLGRIVEEGEADATLTHPTHTYTRGLLEAVPKLGSDTEFPETGA